MKKSVIAGAIPFVHSSESGAETNDRKKPNVLLIMTDTQRKDDMGAFGNPVIQTPHLDALANSGVKFDQCYTQCPACMPARATVFTGRYLMAHRVWSNGVSLPEDEITLAHAFAQNGYRTGGAGKIHFEPHFPYRSPLPLMETHPEPYYGFQEFHLGEDGRSGEHWIWMKKHHPKYVNEPDHRIPVELHNSYWSASHTIDFIQDCARKKDPFFAFCSFVDPHQSYNPPSPYREMYQENEMPSAVRKKGELDGGPFKKLAEGRMKRYTERTAYHRTQHYGEMSLIDDSVGRILETLDRLNLRETTLIVFVSDHGDMLGDHWLWWKGAYHYPGCANVPLFFNWPGHLQSGKTVNGTVQQTDIFPTIAEMAGIDTPPGVQGKSLKHVLMSDAQETGYEFAYIESIASGAHSPHYSDSSGKKRQKTDARPSDTLTIRSKQWRLTFYTGSSDGELYDLEDDPNEFNNRWNDPALKNVKGELMVELLNHTAATRDPLPLRNKPY